MLKLLFCLFLVVLTLAEANADLPSGVIRGPLLHEHSFQSPMVDDWWLEGVPHFMIGGSAVANEHFMRLTTHTLDDHGFAFNTAPLDHENWEARVKFSIRPPAEGAMNQDKDDDYQGGDGLVFWYLKQPIGDDHQHVVKYSKSLSTEVVTDLLDKQNPWRLADQILIDDDEDDDGLDDVDDLTEEEKQDRAERKEKLEVKRQKREELFRKLFKRGTSFDNDDVEPRILGVKYSDFSSGFAIVLDSVGDEEDHNKGGAHHKHKSSIYLLLNVPNHTSASGSKIVNNFSPSRSNFRKSPSLLKCDYNFRQEASRMYDPAFYSLVTATRLLRAPEVPLELIVRYYNKKLTVIVVREDVAQRKITRNDNNEPEVSRSFTETLCGELYPLNLPQKYHFGLSAATGHRPMKERKNDPIESLFYEPHQKAVQHVDVHDVFSFQLRELGKDAKAMGYSKSIPIEHFDFQGDKKKREHFSRQIPVEPDADE